MEKKLEDEKIILILITHYTSMCVSRQYLMVRRQVSSEHVQTGAVCCWFNSSREASRQYFTLIQHQSFSMTSVCELLMKLLSADLISSEDLTGRIQTGIIKTVTDVTVDRTTADTADTFS